MRLALALPFAELDAEPSTEPLTALSGKSAVPIREPLAVELLSALASILPDRVSILRSRRVELLMSLWPVMVPAVRPIGSAPKVPPSAPPTPPLPPSSCADAGVAVINTMVNVLAIRFFMVFLLAGR